MIAADKVQSFTIDHTKLKWGIYVARSYRGVTTFDVRITAPNVEPAICGPEYHSIEHMMSTWMRNSEVQDDVVAVDGMACCTGFYVIMFDHKDGKPYTVEEMRDLMIRCMSWIETQKEVPATTPATCGNCTYHNLAMAIYWSRKYKERLLNDFHSEYTKLEVYLDNGMKFADS